MLRDKNRHKTKYCESRSSGPKRNEYLSLTRKLLSHFKKSTFNQVFQFRQKFCFQLCSNQVRVKKKRILDSICYNETPHSSSPSLLKHHVSFKRKSTAFERASRKQNRDKHGGLRESRIKISKKITGRFPGKCFEKVFFKNVEFFLQTFKRKLTAFARVESKFQKDRRTSFEKVEQR